MFRKYLKRFYSQQHEKETGLNEYVHNFSVDNNIIDNNYIINIDKYLMRKNKV